MRQQCCQPSFSPFLPSPALFSSLSWREGRCVLAEPCSGSLTSVIAFLWVLFAPVSVRALMSTSSWRNCCFQSWRKICKAVRERHLHLWNSLTCYSETLWVEKEGNHYLPVTHPPAHFPPAYSPESADFSLSLHKGRNAGKKLNYTLPSCLTCWFLSGIIEVLDNWLFHASVGERCL